MPVFVHPEAAILFVHIPRCGGSEIAATARCLGYDVYHQIAGNIWRRNMRWSRCSPQHFHASLPEQVIDLASIDEAFATVCHPVQRLVSEYQYQRRTGLTHEDDPRAWMGRMLEGRAADPFFMDNHFRPQVDFLPEGMPGFATWRMEDGGVEKARAVLERRAPNQPPSRRGRIRRALGRLGALPQGRHMGVPTPPTRPKSHESKKESNPGSGRSWTCMAKIS